MVQELVLRRLIGQLGPAGRIVWDLLGENQALKEELERTKFERDAWKEAAQSSYKLKGRSPARWRFRVVRWEVGEAVIKPKEFPGGKVVPNLRLHVPLEDADGAVPYWDINSKRLIAMLLPVLPHIAGTNTYVEIIKHGDGRTSQYSMSIHPA